MFGLIKKEYSWSFLNTKNSISSSVETLINVDTSKMLVTSLLSMPIILSFFFKPEIKAGLPSWTLSITAGVTSLPDIILIIAKITMAKTKFASGPAATIIDRWYKGLSINNFFLSSSLYLLITSSCSDSLKTFRSPKNFT